MKKLFDDFTDEDCKNFLKNRNEDLLPPILEYFKNLDIAVCKFKIVKEAARRKYGQFTIKQWNELFNNIKTK